MTGLQSSRFRECALSVIHTLRMPEDTFGESSASPKVVIDVAGAPFVLRDALSYENGAAGIVALARLTGDREVLANYEHFIRSNLASTMNPNSPGVASAFLGGFIASDIFRRSHPAWERAHSRFLESLNRKVESEISILDKCFNSSQPMPSFQVFDSILGLSRSTALIAGGKNRETIPFLQRASVSIRNQIHTGLKDEYLPCHVAGPPFIGLPQNESPTSHWNFGMAHGSTGLVLAAVRIASLFSEMSVCEAELDSLNRAISGYYSWAEDIGLDGSLPMYAENATNGARFSVTQVRPSWCYGALGQELAKLSAGLHLRRDDLTSGALAGLRRAAQRVEECHDLSLCHGVSGLAAGLALAAAATKDPELRILSAQTAEVILDHYDEGLPFRFSYASDGLNSPVSLPGVLNGAGGVAMALLLCGEQDIPRWYAREALLSGAPWTNALPTFTEG